MSSPSTDMTLRSFQRYYTGVLSAETSCSLKDFESVARSVRRSLPSAEFDPPFALTQSPSQNLQCALVSFQSLADICACIRLQSCNYKLGILLKSKKVTKNSPTFFLRIVGSMVLEHFSQVGDTATPFIFLPGFGNGALSGEKTVTVLYRPRSHFDYRNNEYEARLQKRQMKVANARVMVKATASLKCPMNEDQDFYDDLFSLRWRRLPSLSKSWSKDGNGNTHISGILQLCFPYIVVHGHDVIKEFSAIMTTDVNVDIVSREDSNAREYLL